jgi:hypothetical protein
MRQCAFCPSTASLTGEHLRSDWVNKLLEGRTHRYDIYQRSYGTTPTRWTDKRFDVKANVVCGDCNSGWMSDVDNDAKHCLHDIVLHDCNVCILPEGLAAIAAYTMKSAFIGDYITRHREPFFDQQTRQQFAQSRRLLEEAHMWIGRIRQPRGQKKGIYKTRYGQPHGSTVVRLLDTYVFTFSIEAILLQLAITRFNDPIVGDSAYSPELNQEKRLDGMLIPFWPLRVVNRGMEWPPTQNIHYSQLEEVADRFTHLTISV